MSVTNYDNITCKYTIGKLDKMVYFVPESAIGAISLDGTVDYVYSASTNQALECYALSLSEGDTLDERYEFTHSLNFSVKGYMNKNDIEYKHVIVKDKEGTYWLLNPMLPCKLTYTYTLDATSNHTDFVVGTKSNYPMLKVENFNPEDIMACSGYDHCGFDYLELNETKYSKIDDDAVYYSNDGFKVINYLKNTATFTETYDGTNVSHELKFNINFSDYKASWHYTLLEFQNNKYAAVISTKCGSNIACGFGYGLQPSFTVTASDTQFNNIEIKLSDLHDQGHLIWMPQDVPYSHTTGTTWSYVQDEYECVNTKQAKHLLMQEYDFFGNTLDNYMCLEGYESQYEDLNIVGTYPYSSAILFNCKYCKPLECGMETSIPKKITFTESGECKAYSIKCDSFFTLSASSNDITVYPISGLANTYYSVRICNFAEPTTSGTLNYTVIANYCDDKAKTFNVEVIAPSPTNCLPQGEYYNISPDAQNVTIPTSCCITSGDCINDANAHSFQIQNGYVTFRANDNQTGSERQFIINLMKCNGTTITIYVNQASFYSRWVVEQRTCYGYNMCDFERMYSGETASDVNTPTYYTRWNNCEPSAECSDRNTRWVETSYTGCSEGRMCVVEQMQISYDNGQTWSNTGQMRYGRVLPDVSGQCSTNIEHWILVEGYLCDDTTKYSKERLYLEEYYGQPEEDWLATDSYRRGYEIAYDSVDCGGGGTQYTYIEWRSEGTMCNGYNKYIRLREYGSNDTVTWVALDVYKQGSVIEEFSDDCGYIPPYEFRWVSADTTTCVGYNLYQNYKKQQRIASDTGATWSDVIPTIYSYDGEGSMTPVLLEENSSQCGYVPPIEPQYRWVNLDPSVDYYCDGTKKYYKQKRQISVDSGVTWSDVTPLIYNRGNLIDAYSTDCGYIPQAIYEWRVITPTSDPNTYVCEDCDIQPTNAKWLATYTGGTVSSAECDSTSAITSREVVSTDLVSVSIGECVTSIGVGAFKSCTSLTSIDIPNSVVYIDQNVFYNCTSLSSITIGSGVRSIGNSAFGRCSGLTSITIPNSITSIGSSAFYESRLITMNSGTNGVFNLPSSVGGYAFYGCSGMTNLTLGNNVTSIGSCAFEGCSNLTNVTIPSSVTRIGNSAFNNTPWYRSYSADTSNQYGNIIYINDVAYKAVSTSITSCTFKSGTISISDYAFSKCSGLTNVTIPNSVTTIGIEAFRNCSGLTNVTIPSSVTRIGNSAFLNAPWYRSYSADTSNQYNNVVYINDIAYEAVSTSITSCTFKNGAVVIGDKAFRNCSSLTSVTIPNSITTIGYDAFRSCSSLTSITIPSSVTSVGSGAFDVCSNLTSVTIEASTPPVIEDDIFNQSYSVVIYVPDASVDAYKTAKGWNRYASRIQPIV